VKVKIHKGDTVEIINGKRVDLGKRGEVIRVLPERGYLVVQGVNIRKKHQRQVETQGRRNLSPGIIEFEAPIHISNVMFVCPKCDASTRVGMQRDDEGGHRVCKSCQAVID
jgi:large subunit ribosomal protein L24